MNRIPTELRFPTILADRRATIFPAILCAAELRRQSAIARAAAIEVLG